MNPVLIIKKKRDGKKLSADEIDFMVKGAADGSVPDYQLSAWLMAVFFNGLDEEEISHYLQSMMRSGEVIDLSDIDGMKVDKHSTGGIGDKLSLVIAPAVASAGVVVPMVAGRGLGHTGGTTDKLESIPGFKTEISLKEFKKILKKCSVGIMAQTSKFAPADKKLYSLRDTTATVDSTELIAVSIMCKKLAEGIDALVLDVKTGSGAFMKDHEDAKKLANLMVGIGNRQNKMTRALITDMNQPLGRMLGNSLEVMEAVDVLKGNGPNDVKQICREISSHMLQLAGVEKSLDECRKKYDDEISSGRALEKFVEMVELQGGDAKVIHDTKRLPSSKFKFEFISVESGHVTQIDCEKVGWALVSLGAGRKAQTDRIDFGVGMEWNVRLGDKIEKGDAIAIIHYDDKNRLSLALELLNDSVRVGEKIKSPNLIYEVVE